MLEQIDESASDTAVAQATITEKNDQHQYGALIYLRKWDAD
jgi:hypothetical protein